MKTCVSNSSFKDIVNEENEENKNENEKKCLNFLDINIKNNKGRLSHILVYPQGPSGITSILKGFLATATKTCSLKYLGGGI